MAGSSKSFLGSGLKVSDCRGTPYRVRVGPMGLQHWKWWGGGPNLVAVLFTRLRDLRRSEHRWTVHVTRAGPVTYPTIVEEEYADRDEAEARAKLLASEIVNCAPTWESKYVEWRLRYGVNP